VSTEQDPGIAPRGPVDSLLGSTHLSGYASTGYQAANGWRLDVVANVFDEDRTNGTPQSINSTQWRQGSGEVAGAVGGGLLSARGFGGTQDYRQTFTTVNATRTAETLIRDQSVPSMSAGLGGQWFRAWGAHSLLFGSEARYIDGTSIDTPFAQGQPLPTVEVGGTQRLGSAFVQDTWRPSDRLTIALGAHGDVWHSESGQTGFSKSSGSFNPRASASYRVGESGVIVRGAVYHGFRAPTLNELYRNISVGNTQTRPNEALEPERLTGGDVGVMVTRGRVSARVTGFWNVLDEAITAITLSTTPTLIIKQRANADTVHASGLELEASMRLSSSLSATFAGGFIGSTFQGDTSLNGNEVPQVPDYNLGIGVRYTPSAWSTSAQLRITGPQFEDDQNIYTLRQATVFDVFAGRTLARGVTAFVAVENLFNTTYDVGRTPVLTTGLPRAARVGVMIALP
jgi:iron complex outermembrane recepter protein